MEIKGALYAAVGRRKMGALEYEIQQVGNKFRCQVTLTGTCYKLFYSLIQSYLLGVNYTGMGMSFNKKDAQTNAARDLGQHLIREGLIAPADLPQLSVRFFEAFNTHCSVLLTRFLINKKRNCFLFIKRRVVKLSIGWLV